MADDDAGDRRDDGRADPGGGEAETPRTAAAELFEDGAPRTVGEVARAADLDPGTAESALSALTDAGRLRTKTVGGEDNGAGVRVWYPAPGAAASGPASGTAGESADTGEAGDDGGEAAGGSGGGFAEVGGGIGDAGGTGGDAGGSAGNFERSNLSVDRAGETAAAGGGSGSGPLDDRFEAAIEDLDVPGASEMMRSWRRDAVRAAVEHLRGTDRARRDDVVEAVYPGHRAGYDDPDRWWEFVSGALRTLPDVEEGAEGWHVED